MCAPHTDCRDSNGHTPKALTPLPHHTVLCPTTLECPEPHHTQCPEPHAGCYTCRSPHPSSQAMDASASASAAMDVCFCFCICFCFCSHRCLLLLLLLLLQPWMSALPLTPPCRV